MCRSIHRNPAAIRAVAYGSSFSQRGHGGNAPFGRAVDDDEVGARALLILRIGCSRAIARGRSPTRGDES
jgi:hypothetical protein